MERLPQFEVLDEVFTIVSHNLKVNIIRCGVVRKVCDHLLLYEGIQILLVVLRPATGWKFSHFETRTCVSPNTFGNPRSIFFENLALESPEPRSHLTKRHTTQH